MVSTADPFPPACHLTILSCLPALHQSLCGSWDAQPMCLPKLICGVSSGNTPPALLPHLPCQLHSPIRSPRLGHQLQREGGEVRHRLLHRR
jgi:hypothetical protein